MRRRAEIARLDTSLDSLFKGVGVAAESNCRPRKSNLIVDKPMEFDTVTPCFLVHDPAGYPKAERIGREQLSIMPNTKSAERRMRSGARKHQRNLTVKSRLKTIERKYNVALKDGNKAEAATLLRDAESALDKAAKKGVVHWATSSRKKSRLSRRLVAVA